MTNGKPQITFECTECKAPISVALPVPDLPTNSLRVSVVVVPHEKPITCVCGQHFVFIIEPSPLSVGVMPITKEQAAPLLDRIIVPALSIVK